MKSARRQSKISRSITAGVFLLACSNLSFAARVKVLDGGDFGYYNDSIGTVLDHTNEIDPQVLYLFPGPDQQEGDPVLNPAPEPDLSAAAGVLGQWLNTPPVLNANWRGPGPIPYDWKVNTETAVIFRFDTGGAGLRDFVLEIGADNGIYVWLDGVYRHGAFAPGGAREWEYFIPLGDLAAGTHYLQLLREDHGVENGFRMKLTAVPEPATLALLCLGILRIGTGSRPPGGRGNNK
jgi:hypothetical protein